MAVIDPLHSQGLSAPVEADDDTRAALVLGAVVCALLTVLALSEVVDWPAWRTLSVGAAVGILADALALALGRGPH